MKLAGVDPRPIAVVGADDPVGEALLEALAQSAQAPAAILPVSLEEAEGCVRYGEAELPCQRADEVDWSTLKAVIFAARTPSAMRLARDLIARGCRLVAVEGLATAPAGQLIEVQSAPMAAIARVLLPLVGDAGLRRLSGFIGLPVAARGRGGVDELARQSRALFALEAIEPEVFPVQIAFNLLPQVGEIGEDGLSALERSLAHALQGIWGEEMVAQLTAAWIPTFHGGVVALHGRAAGGLERERLRARLARVPGVLVMEGTLPGAAPTPATDGVDSTDVVLGRLRLEDADAGCFSFWLTYDHSRLEALQLCRGVEKLIESQRN